MEHFAPSSEIPRDVSSALTESRQRDALRRNWPIIVLIVVPLTALVFVVSSLLTPTYRASATIVLTDAGVSRAGGNPELVLRELETLERLATTRTVLLAATRRLRSGSAESLAEKVSAAATAEANLVRVSAEDEDAAGAARIANAVASALLAEQVAAKARSLAARRADVVARIAQLRESSGRSAEIAALRDALRGFASAEAGLGAELLLADRARAPGGPDSPRVVQNTLFALFGFTFIAVLAALAKEHFAPRVGSARGLARLVGTRLLAEMPARRTVTSQERQLELYEPLQEAIRALVDPVGTRTILVTSAHRETVAADVARGLAEGLVSAGESVVVIGSPTGASAPPVSEFLAALEAGSDEADAILDDAETRPNLKIFSHDAAAALGSRGEVASLVEGLAERDTDFIVILGRPLLVSDDGLLPARLMDGLVLVARPERTTRDDAERLGEILRAIDAEVLGIVSVGGSRVVPYAVGVARELDAERT